MIATPVSNDPRALSDWLEASLLFELNGDNTISISDLTRHLEEAEAPEIEMALSDIRRQVDMRSRSIRDSYPIEDYGAGYRARESWDNFIPYSFLLLSSLNQHYVELRFHGGAAQQCAELFELLAGHALERYLNARVVRFGAPRRAPTPKGFSNALQYIAELTCEQPGCGEFIGGDEKDDGLDLLAWVPFSDGKPGQLVLLAQCAIGIDWADKLTELNLELWKGHIRWLVPPIRVFVVPFHHEDGVRWSKSSVRGGIILDRARLASLIEPQDLPRDLVERLREWCCERANQLPL